MRLRRAGWGPAGGLRPPFLLFSFFLLSFWVPLAKNRRNPDHPGRCQVRCVRCQINEAIHEACRKRPMAIVAIRQLQAASRAPALRSFSWTRAAPGEARPAGVRPSRFPGRRAPERPRSLSEACFRNRSEPRMAARLKVFTKLVLVSIACRYLQCHDVDIMASIVLVQTSSLESISTGV